MIYILTGIAKAGKSLVSNEIVKKYGITKFSTDYIMMMLHYGGNNINLDIHASDSSVAKKLEPYIEGLIRTMIENKDTYLIEGVHFNTDFSAKLLKEFKDEIKILYLGYKDIPLDDKVKEMHKYKDVMDNPWLFHFQTESVEEIIEYLIDESKRVYNECLVHNLNYIEIKDINIQKDGIIKELLHK